jgi:hypothetical protein
MSYKLQSFKNDINFLRKENINSKKINKENMRTSSTNMKNPMLKKYFYSIK